MAWYRGLMMASMKSDNSWNRSGHEYVGVYNKIRFT